MVEVGVEGADGRWQSGRDDRRVNEDHEEANEEGPQSPPCLLLGDDISISVPGKAIDVHA